MKEMLEMLEQKALHGNPKDSIGYASVSGTMMKTGGLPGSLQYNKRDFTTLQEMIEKTASEYDRAKWK